MAIALKKDPLFEQYKRTSRVGDIEFWLRAQGSRMTPQTKADFEQLLVTARVDLEKNRMPTGATLQRYIVLTQRHWSERPMAERRRTHMPEFAKVDATFRDLTTRLTTEVTEGLNSQAATATVHDWTVTLAQVNPEETRRFSKWLVTATKRTGLPPEVCELDEKHDKTEAVLAAVRFLEHRLHDLFRELSVSASADTFAPALVPAEPEPDQIAAWEADGGAPEPEAPLVISYGSAVVHHTTTPSPVVSEAPAPAGRLLQWRYAWTIKGERAEGEIAAASEAAARLAIRQQFGFKWLPDRTTIVRAS
jgi:hypothetical protein